MPGIHKPRILHYNIQEEFNGISKSEAYSLKL